MKKDMQALAQQQFSAANQHFKAMKVPRASSNRGWLRFSPAVQTQQDSDKSVIE